MSNDGHRDMSIRPNQIFAVSLPNSPLTKDQQPPWSKSCGANCSRPMGLRTLRHRRSEILRRLQRRSVLAATGRITTARSGPGRSAHFLDAYLRVNHRSPQAIEQAKAWLAPLIEHLSTTGCIGSISEIFGAMPPYPPAGCFAQAWSVAEVLRLATDLGM